MKYPLQIQLTLTPEQQARLEALQRGFAEVCNALVPIVRETHSWNRVTLHHLAYHSLRERFPKMGSQMVCNAIYSVSRTYRIVLQDPQSPVHLSKQAGKPLPVLQFQDSAPVYFDRHTVSLKDGQLSMYTMDGRVHFQISLKSEDELRFHQEKLKEIVLTRGPGGYRLIFWFAEPDAKAGADRDTQIADDILVHAVDDSIPHGASA